GATPPQPSPSQGEGVPSGSPPPHEGLGADSVRRVETLRSRREQVGPLLAADSVRRVETLRCVAFRPVSCGHAPTLSLHRVRRTLSRRLPSEGRNSLAPRYRGDCHQTAPPLMKEGAGGRSARL